MHDAMQYDPIHGQGQEPFQKLFFAIYNGSWQLTTDS